MTVELEVNKIDTYFQKLFPGHDSFGIETDGFNYKTESVQEITYITVIYHDPSTNANGRLTEKFYNTNYEHIFGISRI